MTIDPLNLSLIVSLNSTKDGYITLQIPRSLIDAKTNNSQDDSFIILIDDAEIKPQSDQSNNNYRIITMQFLQGDKNIVLIGTQIIPEFPSALPILIVAITSLIIFYRIKFR
ncbi:MAG: hypothetical protein HY295_05050 [Thaumarchaeota archaeon]|nr:hypothetical protein [Nitrososphaerota archaeon]